MTAYYNEFDPKAAAWLRQLIADGHLPPGDVDERSIEDVTPNDLRGYTQCHFFAGIGGWAYALDLAGWPRDKPVWTGSCPCQPFSTAGQGNGFDDQRHLWPAWFHLINHCRPASIFGEQVASKSALEWLDLVFDDLEGSSYSTAAADLCAASVGALHVRQRIFWVGLASGSRREKNGLSGGVSAEVFRLGNGSDIGGISDPNIIRQPRPGRLERSGDQATEGDGQANWVDYAGGGYWSNAKPVYCADGNTRLIEPSIEPLAHGIPARVVRLSGYGNAIVPQVAAEFIKAVIP